MARMGVDMLHLELCVVFSDVFLMFAFAVALKRLIQPNRSAAGLSMTTVCTIVAARILHLVSLYRGTHYSPKRVPSIVLDVFDWVNASAGVLIICLAFTKYKHTYEREKDNCVSHLLRKLPKITAYVEHLPASPVLFHGIFIVLAMVWCSFRKTHHTFLTNYLSCYHDLCAAFALLPQLWMLYQDRQVSRLLAGFATSLWLSRVLAYIFWELWHRVRDYHQKYPENRPLSVKTEALNILILSAIISSYLVRDRLKPNAAAASQLDGGDVEDRKGM
eukprot:TRINITY_DN17320_c0_g1_i2.p1 TRINITY_DN17320_c0_g1~~TRINITY_DN17320_c0_g1_i2.p1  ORF type:complete len:275 (+),score=17.52 TRINITY_DN17320_c0_g1_i2:125-949(+)